VSEYPGDQPTAQPQVLEIFQRFGTSKEVRLRMSSGLFDLLNTG